MPSGDQTGATKSLLYQFGKGLPGFLTVTPTSELEDIGATRSLLYQPAGKGTDKTAQRNKCNNEVTFQTPCLAS